MIKKDYFCCIPKDMTLEWALEIVHAAPEENAIMSIHWTQELDTWPTMEAAQRAMARYLNRDEKRIIKYTEVIEEM